jgi:uncharacterized protein YebE (UPF0316 family)
MRLDAEDREVTLPVLPLLVFSAETCVVTLCTVRTIFIARGRKGPAALIGFFEVSIWLFAIGKVMQNLGRPDCYLAFAFGFSLGNYLGVFIERKLAFGTVAVHITTRKEVGELVENLRSANYGVTTLDAHGATGPASVVFTVVNRKDLDNVQGIIESFDDRAFYSVGDLQTAAQGIFPRFSRGEMSALLTPLKLLRHVKAVSASGLSELPTPTVAGRRNPQAITHGSDCLRCPTDPGHHLVVG